METKDKWSTNMYVNQIKGETCWHSILEKKRKNNKIMPTWINNKPTKQIGYENRTLICTDPSNNFGQFSDDPWTDLSPTITSWGRSCFGNPEVSISHILLRDFTGIFYPLSIYNPEVSTSDIAQGMHRDFTGIYYRKVRLENAFNL